MMGYTPFVRAKLETVLYVLHHGRFKMIIFDQHHSEIDIIELILSIRDIDSNLPVVILGAIENEKIMRILKEFGRIFIIEAKLNQIKNKIMSINVV